MCSSINIYMRIVKEYGIPNKIALSQHFLTFLLFSKEKRFHSKRKKEPTINLKTKKKYGFIFWVLFHKKKPVDRPLQSTYTCITLEMKRKTSSPFLVEFYVPNLRYIGEYINVWHKFCALNN